jgi:integrase
MATHSILEGKVKVYKRGEGQQWQCSTYLDGKNRRVSTKEEGLAQAKEWAEDWYWGLRDKKRRGELISERTFGDVAPVFMDEFEVITDGQRSPLYVQGHQTRLDLHLIPFFGKMGLSQITAGKVQEYRVHRIKTAKDGKHPARSTIHQELVVLRQVLKTAIRHQWLDRLPDLSAPYKAGTKISHRGWFSPEEYKQLYKATGHRAQHPLKERWRWASEQLHDFVLFMANTGLRPDEAARLEHRDIEIVKDDATGQTILVIQVRGKRGTGWCKSLPTAVRPYERLKARPTPASAGQPRNPRRAPKVKNAKTKTAGETKQVNGADRPLVEGELPRPTDRVFPGNQRALFNNILVEEGLKTDREGNERTAYSLRHTYICLRLMEGADIYQIAKNCRTSVEMIEKYYASHIQTTLNAAQINVLRPRPRARSKKVSDAEE